MCDSLACLKDPSDKKDPHGNAAATFSGGHSLRDEAERVEAWVGCLLVPQPRSGVSVIVLAVGTVAVVYLRDNTDGQFGTGTGGDGFVLQKTGK